jgi:transposase
MAMTIVEAAPGITGGVDTHLDKHVAAALDPLGRLVGTESFEADAGGYKALLAWLEEFGQVTKVGVEGTGSYGVGLSRFLRRKGVEVVEVNRPNRQSRRNQGKSDPLDAVEAARAAISGRASGAGKTMDGPVEAIRVLVVAKRSARQARVKAITQMRHLGITAPDQLHSRLKGLSVKVLVAEGAKLRSTRSPDPVTAATKASLSSLAHRIQGLDQELAELDEKIESLLLATAPDLMSLLASGPTLQQHFWWRLATIPNASIPRPPGPTCVACPRFQPTRARTPGICVATTAVIVRPTARCGVSPWSGSLTTRRPPTTSTAG